MEVKPTRKNVLVAEIARETTSSGGIIIEGARSTNDHQMAKALAIGSEVEFVQVGDELLIDWAKGHVVTVDGEQRVLISEDHVIAIIDKDQQ